MFVRSPRLCCSSPPLAREGEGGTKSTARTWAAAPPPQPCPQAAEGVTLLPRLLEIAQIGRRLVLLRRHEITVAADKVPFLPDVDVHVVFRAQVFVELDLAGHPLIALRHRPGPRQRVVVSRDLVQENIPVRLVEGQSFLDAGLFVAVPPHPAAALAPCPL